MEIGPQTIDPTGNTNNPQLNAKLPRPSTSVRPGNDKSYKLTQQSFLKKSPHHRF